MSSMNDTLARLARVVESRRDADPDKSYVARLFAKGPDAVLKKIGEEATEVAVAGSGGGAVPSVWLPGDVKLMLCTALATWKLPVTCAAGATLALPS